MQRLAFRLAEATPAAIAFGPLAALAWLAAAWLAELRPAAA